MGPRRILRQRKAAGNHQAGRYNCTGGPRCVAAGMERALTTEEANTRILIASSPDPKTCERYLDSFQDRHPEYCARLNASSSGLQYLVAVFSYSRFLSEALLQFPEWISIFDAEDLYRVLTVEDFKLRLESSLEAPLRRSPARSLALFRRRELLRILIRDVVGHASLSEITEEISNLADAILDVTYRRIRASLEARYGKPRSRRRTGLRMLLLRHRARQAWRPRTQLQL